VDVEQKLALNMAAARLNGYVAAGAGENLVASAGDYENFLAARVELKPAMEADLRAVTNVLARAAGRCGSTRPTTSPSRGCSACSSPPSGSTATRAAGPSTTSRRSATPTSARIKALGGGDGGAGPHGIRRRDVRRTLRQGAAAHAPPLRKLLDSGVPLGAGTDGTRVSSYNPWVSLYWMTTGKTVGGLKLYADADLLTRAEALRLYTVGSAWFSGGEAERGRLAPGQLADFAVLSEDYFAVDPERIKEIQSLLTVTGGDVVHAAGEFDRPGLAPEPLPPASPAWSPVAFYGGYQHGR
jgi:hypothetical protein